MKTVEILQYNLHKGTGAFFHNVMAEISVPLHQRHGIDVVSFGHSLHDLDCYYLIRALKWFT
ncbi:TPA: NIPSNAP family protein, partial [Enterobacter ludwigii]